MAALDDDECEKMFLSSIELIIQMLVENYGGGIVPNIVLLTIESCTYKQHWSNFE